MSLCKIIFQHCLEHRNYIAGKCLVCRVYVCRSRGEHREAFVYQPSPSLSLSLSLALSRSLSFSLSLSLCGSVRCCLYRAISSPARLLSRTGILCFSFSNLLCFVAPLSLYTHRGNLQHTLMYVRPRLISTLALLTHTVKSAPICIDNLRLKVCNILLLPHL